jgi:hypothetical protein
VSTTKPGDPRKVDPFAPKGKIELEQLPLSALKRWLLGNLELEKAQVPPESVPIFGVERGSGASQSRNIGNLTLGTSTSWAALSTRVTCQIGLSGLRDMVIHVGGTAIETGAASAHAVSVLIDGIEYQTMVHDQAANTGNGLLYIGSAAARGWHAWGRVPANLVDRKVYTVEIVTRLISGTNTGTMYGDSANLINLYALEM